MRALAFCLLLLGSSAWAQRAKGIEANSVELAVGVNLRGGFLGTDVLTAPLLANGDRAGSAGLGLHFRMNKLLGNVLKIGVAFGGLADIGGPKPNVSLIEWRPLTTFVRANMGREDGQGFFLELIPLGVSLFSATVTYPGTTGSGGSTPAVAIVATTSYSSYRFGAQAGYRWRGLEFSGGFQFALGGRVTVMELGTSIAFYFFPW
ncbi:MAG: hypothetical protein H6Q89_2145 [Myxococcaceae bacterium]|nr:hypothetical protein [Myxococcaceae bacterium]